MISPLELSLRMVLQLTSCEPVCATLLVHARAYTKVFVPV